MTHSVALTNQMVAKPRCGMVRLPVVAVPCRYMVSPEPCVMVRLPEVLLYRDSIAPSANTLAGMVMPAESLMTLPRSPTAAVVVVVEDGAPR
jgi:hypothetical protein